MGTWSYRGEGNEDTVLIRLGGDLRGLDASIALENVSRWFERRRPTILTLDLSEVEKLDRSGVGALAVLTAYVLRHGASITIRGLSGEPLEAWEKASAWLRGRAEFDSGEDGAG